MASTHQYVGTTHSVTMKHPKYTKRDEYVYAEFHQPGLAPEIKITAISATSNDKMYKCSPVIIEQEEYKTRPKGEQEEAKWALGKLGWTKP